MEFVIVSLTEITIAVPAELTAMVEAKGAVLSIRIVARTAEDRLFRESPA
jgi:hypothetical protein